MAEPTWILVCITLRTPAIRRPFPLVAPRRGVNAPVKLCSTSFARQVFLGFVRACVALGGVSLLAFVVVSAPPGDFLSDASLTTRASAETVRRWRDRFALDRPFAERYFRWAGSVLRGDAGVSMAYEVPVSRLFRARAGVTALLGGTALLASWVIALACGVWAATRAEQWDGRALSYCTAALMGVPDLLIALGLLLAAARFGWLPTSGVMDDLPADASALARASSVARHLLIPVVALTLSLAPTLARHVRASLVSILSAPYLVAQRARGVPVRRLVWRAALRAAAPPLLPLFGLSLAAAFSASMVVEAILSWPGLGPLMLEAVHARDQHVVLAGVMCSAALITFGNLLSSILLPLVDPRVERGSARSPD